MLRARHARHPGMDERLVLEEVQVAPHPFPGIVRRARRLAASRLGAVETRAGRETDRDMQFAFAVRPVAELHARHPPRVGQLQGGGEQRSGIHTTKLPERPRRQSAFTHTKQRKAILRWVLQERGCSGNGSLRNRIRSGDFHRSLSASVAEIHLAKLLDQLHILAIINRTSNDVHAIVDRELSITHVLE